MGKIVKIGLLGLGTVGSGVWKFLSEKEKVLEEKIGARIEVKKILVQNLSKKRAVTVPQNLLTTNASEILNDREIQILVEMIGGVVPEPYLREGLEKGKQIVTANKALLAERGESILGLAAEKRLRVGFEAAVAGGIPIVRAIRDGFVGNRIDEIYGIINGTSNFILSAMTQSGTEFSTALSEAQKRGFAERDPSMDVSGRDAAQKLALLISLTADCFPPIREVFLEGIERITPYDISAAQRMGYVIKLLAISKRVQGKIEARVHPTLIPRSHPLADVGGVFNAIFLKGDAVGEAMFYGLGAGMMPTASAVVSDIAQIAQEIIGGHQVNRPQFNPISISPMDDLVTDYYLRFSVVDRPGVLAQIANSLGRNDISISSVYQYEQDQGARVPIVVTTHQARERNVQKAIREIDQLETVLDKTMLIRVERL